MKKNEEVIKVLEDMSSESNHKEFNALSSAISTLKRIDVEKIREVQANAFLGCMDAPKAIVNYLQGEPNG